MSEQESKGATTWRAELRRGDPACGEALDPAEAAALRRAMAAAAAEVGRGWPMRPAGRLLVAAAAVAVCGLVAGGWHGLLRWRELGGAPGSTPARRVELAAGARQAGTEAAPRRAGAALPGGGGGKLRRRAAAHPIGEAASMPESLASAGVAPGAASPAAADSRDGTAAAIPGTGMTLAEAAGTAAPPAPGQADETQASETARQVQFATPGGTRVIWVMRGDDLPR
jgi:hypothetical protein